MDLIILLLVIATLQVIALGAASPAFFQFMRVGMPVLALGAVVSLVQADAEVVWVAAFVMVALTFAVLPEMPPLVWAAINFAIAALCFGYVGSVAVANLL